MGTVTDMLLYLVVGSVGGLIGWRLKVPGGVIVGSMLAVIIFQTLFHKNPNIPSSYGFFVQVLIGVMVGTTFSPETIQNLKILAVPVLLSTLTLLFSGLAISLILAKKGILDIPTAYLATSPGAMSTLVGLAIESGANATLVVAFHVFRLTTVNLTAPLVFALLAWWLKK